MDDKDEAPEGRISARQAKKKKKKSGGGGEKGGEEAAAPRKKKKKKKKPSATGGGDGAEGAEGAPEDGDHVQRAAGASRGASDEGGEDPPRRKRKKKKSRAAASEEDRIDADSSGAAAAANEDDDNGQGVAMAAVASADFGGAAMQSMAEDLDGKCGYDDNNYDEEGGGGGDAGLMEKDRYQDENFDRAIQVEQEGMDNNNNGYGNEDGTVEEVPAAYCFEADTEIMAEINQEGLVQVDESGGIQAFIAETIAIDGDAVGIIRSDAEIEKEEKKKYTKYFCGAVAVMVVVIVAVAVPVTLKFAKGEQQTRVTRITADPTMFPSLMPSQVPSSMPSSVRFTEIVRKLEDLSGDALRVQGSPQYRAAMWMADEDPMVNLTTGETGLEIDNDNDDRFRQRYIMVLFYFAMDGDNWENNEGWLGGASECEWFGIMGSSYGCPKGCIRHSDVLGDYDRICRISIGVWNNLYGEIPSELGELTEMRWFEIQGQGQYLFGTIPESVGRKWTELHTMLLGYNALSGGFPDTFENNEMLGTIYIHHNKFNGTFPNVLTSLKNLEWFQANNNKFVGTLPDSLGNLTSLRIFNVNNNNLTGNLPDSWDETNLIEDLEVSGNNFTGRLPTSLAKAKGLKDFRASQNQLSGSIPVEYYQLENLEELYLDENEMVGKLPQTDEPFYDGLQEFSIHSNGFEGRFPVEYFEDTIRIKVLSLHGNQLTGSITENICARKNASRAYTQLQVLTADCDLMSCSCCTCYECGEPVQGAGS